MLYSFADVEADDLAAIKAAENEIGTPLLAMQPVDLSPAPLDSRKLAQLKSLEDRLGVVLVAVKH